MGGCWANSNCAFMARGTPRKDGRRPSVPTWSPSVSGGARAIHVYSFTQAETTRHDYVSAGIDESMDWLEAELAKAYEIQTQKLGGSKQQKAEGKVLNRILRHTASGWEIEADPRYAEFVIEQLGLDNDSGVATPGVSGADEEDLDTSVPLVGDDITKYQGVISRCNYLGPIARTPSLR